MESWLKGLIIVGVLAALLAAEADDQPAPAPPPPTDDPDWKP